MRIQNNVVALNAMNQYSRNQGRISGDLEKLSSGYRINRAGDDAAGLAISEKLRVLITGTEQAIKNARQGIGLLQTGEGALTEVHDMLNRLKALSEQSANGLYSPQDRDSLQEELEQICEEVGRIAKGTNFNGINLFQDKGLSFELSAASASQAAVQSAAAEELRFICLNGEDEGETFSLSELTEDEGEGLQNIIYTGTVIHDYATAQSTSGTPNSFSGNDAELAETLERQIVPQVVKSLLTQYPAFNYLNGSSIGIGLRIYNENTTVLASVGVEYKGLISQGNSRGTDLAYTLSVNTKTLDFENGELTVVSRSALERTICHEMIHALMDEATTTGMLGKGTTGDVAKFPAWFVEGMAQTASGPGNWISGGVGSLGLTASSTTAQITTALKNAENALTNSESKTAAQYGSGYLACMYLGAKAAGMTVDDAAWSSSTGAATKIASGLSMFMEDVINGLSLDGAIKKYTNFAGLADFESKFATDSDAPAVVKKLLETGCTSGGKGGLASGDLRKTDPVGDEVVADYDLFKLDTSTTQVNNNYQGISDYTVLSGGGATVNGVSPLGETWESQTQAKFTGNPFTIGGIRLLVGPEAEEYNYVNVPQFYLSEEALRMDEMDISTQEDAFDTMDLVEEAIDRISTIRGSYGALQNRLEHTINSLSVGLENLTDAESVIRDTDVGEQMSAFIRHQIMSQASQAMLAQANALPEGVMNLLR